MRNFVKVLAWVFLVVSAIVVLAGLTSLPSALDTSTNSPVLPQTLLRIVSGLSGMLLSGTSLLVVQIATHLAEGGLKITLTDLERTQIAQQEITKTQATNPL